ncbi:ABC transporter substrate-binding protein [Billgrantia endophytica]|uniref:ABC transporter substrate-binding protein n=2 Tax=Billgrantia endophytica TaxID=2033802 RepID=A0A2N7UAT8_9GAMM|nr:iron-siderophore ABC transporter substrate-binding protein [Halomonas endophytica]PMR77552.1 ABC transporter substrate-binding protein [Halomonas endophytica]
MAIAMILCLPLASAQARTLETAFGEVTLNGEARRVVTLYEGALDTALAAGVTPVGAVTTRGGDGVARYLDDYLDDIAIVGVVREINIEAVLMQRPDLILATPLISSEQYALLSRIAPTVVPATDGFSPDAWKDEARLFAQALDREEEVEAAIADVEARAAELASALAEHEVDNDVVLVRWMPQGPMVMSTQIFASGLLDAAGLEVNDSGLVREGAGHSDPLSLENLSQVDRDWLFLATLNEEGREALDAARRSPAFDRLNVVQNERVIPVDGQLWSSASGPLAAQAILDQLEAALLP